MSVCVIYVFKYYMSLINDNLIFLMTCSSKQTQLRIRPTCCAFWCQGI